jgi:hypothetical protein
MTPEQKNTAIAAMIAYIRLHTKELAAAIVEEIAEGEWETSIHDAAVEALIGHLSDEEHEKEIDQVLTDVTPLLGIRAMFQFHLGDHCEYVIVERNLPHVSR